MILFSYLFDRKKKKKEREKIGQICKLDALRVQDPSMLMVCISSQETKTKRRDKNMFPAPHPLNQNPKVVYF